ncbi:MAG: hypothetical protein EAZ42_08090 [Verrucomicrobia bacterium]|nr:MAG: hypothetical protein EAZ42_08090 [Verrucomicrobiota bacterium]
MQTRDATRRWSAFICPQCQFVFRVPKAHLGQRALCPGCQAWVRIPDLTEETPELKVPQTAPISETQTLKPADLTRIRRKKRSKGKRSAKDEVGWERDAHRSSSKENRQLRLLMICGAVLFFGALAGISFLFLNKEKPLPPLPTSQPPVVAADSTQQKIADITPTREQELLKEAEPLVANFLNATTIQEILPLIRNPEKTEAKILAMYPDGTFPALGLTKFNEQGKLAMKGKLLAIPVRLRSGELRPIAVLFDHDQLKIDWESWVGWSEMSWPDFLEKKPATPVEFRVDVSDVDYYNFSFTDDKKWQSYQLRSVDGEHLVYAYVLRDSELHGKLKPLVETKTRMQILKLKYPEGALREDQVIIDSFVHDGWVISE